MSVLAAGIVLAEPGNATGACRLFAAAPGPDAVADLDAHLERFGEVPLTDFPEGPGRRLLVETIARAGLRGRGGAGFPLADKLRAVRHPRRSAVVVANGCESDPTSSKDAVLLQRAPHLVLDGLALAAHVLNATQAVLAVPAGSPLAATLALAADERDDDVAVVIAEIPRRFVASESSALVAGLSGGRHLPTGARTATRGVRGRPTLVSNVETLAHLALVARYGDEWFRGLGTDGSPGSMLITVGGAVVRPGVQEAPFGLPVSDALELAGGETEQLSAVLVGGLGGTWLPVVDAWELPLAHETCLDVGVTMGVASLVALPATACGVAETAAILRRLAGESAGQCGPCLFGLPAIADDVAHLATGRVDADLLPRLRRRLGVIAGRGACGHPDGAVRMAASALHTFAEDVDRHADGQLCPGADAQAGYRVPLSFGGA